MRFEEYTDRAGGQLAVFRQRKEFEPDPASLPCLLFALPEVTTGWSSRITCT
jgi:hypothetical protein